MPGTTYLLSMAKLSAHGTEVARFERIKEISDRGDIERTTYSFRSDGALLLKRDIQWHSDGAPRRCAMHTACDAVHAYGWKSLRRASAKNRERLEYTIEMFHANEEWRKVS